MIRKSLLVAVVVSVLPCGAAFAADVACDTKANSMKLMGKAKESFLKKCERDSAPSSCQIEADKKQLAGASRSTFIKTCLRPVTGQAAEP